MSTTMDERIHNQGWLTSYTYIHIYSNKFQKGILKKLTIKISLKIKEVHRRGSRYQGSLRVYQGRQFVYSSDISEKEREAFLLTGMYYLFER